MAVAKIGKDGSLVIPTKERNKADIAEGDDVEIVARESGLIVIKKALSLKKIQQKLAGKLPQWRELEGSVDEVLDREV